MLVAGKTFGEAVFWFETAIVCGIIAEDGRTFINPNDKTILKVPCIVMSYTILN